MESRTLQLSTTSGGILMTRSGECGGGTRRFHGRDHAGAPPARGEPDQESRGVRDHPAERLPHGAEGVGQLAPPPARGTGIVPAVVIERLREIGQQAPDVPMGAASGSERLHDPAIAGASGSTCGAASARDVFIGRPRRRWRLGCAARGPPRGGRTAVPMSVIPPVAWRAGPAPPDGRRRRGGVPGLRRVRMVGLRRSRGRRPRRPR